MKILKMIMQRLKRQKKNNDVLGYTGSVLGYANTSIGDCFRKFYADGTQQFCDSSNGIVLKREFNTPMFDFEHYKTSYGELTREQAIEKYWKKWDASKI